MSNLKTIKLNILKKNRVYFACKNESGYDVKLKITPASADLPLGVQDLLVKDISIRSSYGVDVIYTLEAELKGVGITTLTHRYNKNLVEKCKELGGKWDSANQTWVFTKLVEDKVEELDFLYNSEPVNIEITAKGDRFGHQDAVYFCGYPLCRATGRDSGAMICDNVSLVSGSVDSSGSMKNWGTKVSEGCQFRLTVSKELLAAAQSDTDVTDHWEMAILNGGAQ